VVTFVRVARFVDYASVGVPLAFICLFLAHETAEALETEAGRLSGLMLLQSVFRNGVA